jgi:phosphatidate phosphatase PAH1
MPVDALSMSKQKIQVKDPYQAEEIDIETGETNTVTRYHIIPISDCRWIPTDLLPRKATQAELDEVATAIAQAQILAETTRQEAKSDSLKAVENNFLALCDSLTSTTSHTKLTFAQIASIGDAMTDQALHISIAIQLLSIDAEGKTLGGLSWWYDCAWHPEIIEAE